MLNFAIMMGRLVRDPDINFSEESPEKVWGRYRLAVERDFKKSSGQDCDFFNCLVTGSKAKFAAKYLSQGSKIVVKGRLQSGSYVDKESGKKIATVEIFVVNQYFADSHTKQEYGEEEYLENEIGEVYFSDNN